MYNIRVLAGDESVPQRYVQEIFHIDATNCSKSVDKPPPKFGSPTVTLSATNCTSGAIVGTVKASNGIQPLEYEMAGGADTGLFAIDPSTG